MRGVHPLLHSPQTPVTTARYPERFFISELHDGVFINMPVSPQARPDGFMKPQ